MLLAFTLLNVLRFALANYENAADKLLIPILPNGVSDSENVQCNLDSILYRENLDNLTLWAQQMWDASAKSAEGILQGNIFQLGNFEECVRVTGPLKTQYCLATINLNIPENYNSTDPFSLYYSPYDSVLYKLKKRADLSQLSRSTIHTALCAPSSCQPKDLENNLNKYLSNLQNNLFKQHISYNATVSEGFCQTKNENREITGAAIGFGILSAALLLCVVLATACNVRSKSRVARVFQKVLSPFSLRQNIPDLLKTDSANSTLGALYGIKVIAICMIVAAHRYSLILAGPMINYEVFEKEYRGVAAWSFLQGDLFVDVFFVLGGILLSYRLLAQLDKKFVNPGLLIVLRYLRLTPVYAFCIFYYASVMYYIDEGPMWKPIFGTEQACCQKNWWINLLYLHNYIDTDNMCMDHSWYLACDFHFFLIGLFLIILISKHKKTGFALLGIFTCVSLLIPLIIAVVYMRPPILRFFLDFTSSPKTHIDFRLLHTKSHARAAPYFSGIFAGYIYYKWKDSSEKLPKLKSRWIGILSVFLLLASTCSGGIFYDPYHPYNAMEAGMYAALHRLGRSLGVVGILFVCSHGHATVLRRILTWPPFVPLSRLILSVYIIHFHLCLRHSAATKTPMYISYYNFVTLGISEIVVSFVIALVLYLTVEIPIKRVFEMIIFPDRKTHTALPVQTAKRPSITNVEQNNTDTKL